jgi:predicted Rossmann-fold nucleotide-binding protein
MEIETLEQLDRVLASGRPLAGLRFQGLDLASRADRLIGRDATGLVVLGGTTTAELERWLSHHGALVFPTVTDCPVDPYRARLYRPEELYAGLEDGYDATADARAYAWHGDRLAKEDILATLLRAVHDDSVNDALGELLAGLPVVGVMGGHALPRGSAEYRDAARLARALARVGLVVITGGGPGAMEAANLGAHLAVADDDALEEALDRLAAVPSFVPDVAAWARVALEVRAALPVPERLSSVSVPTWFYGHEPPNVFSDHIAKYFSNAVREDTLLARCTAGVVYLPGAAGTVQEIFQAVTPGYYSASGGAPLVLVGRRHWEEALPVWPLLQALADRRQLAHRVHLVDGPDEPDGAVLPEVVTGILTASLKRRQRSERSPGGVSRRRP